MTLVLTLTLDVPDYPSTTLDSCPKLSQISKKIDTFRQFYSGKSSLQEVFTMIKGKQDLGLF